LRTINAKASIYLFDEPFEGVDPVNKEIMKDIIRNLAKDKIVLIITHDYEDLANLYYEDIKLK
ncbi:MAG: ABC transporter ATP-binding protein, partial [Anaerococcus sp.]|nr:ABC transporter ATP-binding protein [Anaerococcus sp.]